MKETLSVVVSFVTREFAKTLPVGLRSPRSSNSGTFV